jgi:hypothetical protein
MWILMSWFFLANILWLVAVINNSFFDIVNPKFVASSFDKHQNEEELESILLKSLKKYIGKYFQNSGINYSYITASTKEQKINLDLKNEENVVNADSIQKISQKTLNGTILNEVTKNYQPFTIGNSSKISMFLDSTKKLVYILKISNDKESTHRFDSKVGEVSLFSIPITNFVKADEDKPIIEDAMIKKCWSVSFAGRIVGGVTSNDKSTMSIFYRMVKGHTVSYRVRFFHDLTCENGEIELTNDLFSEKVESYLKDKGKSSKILEEDMENYFEINNYKSKSEEDQIKLENIFNDKSFDDFTLKGNTPINAMAVKKGVLAYARNMDYRQFYILKRDQTEKKWKVSLLGPAINKTVHRFFHTNSLKFAKDDRHDYKLLQIFVAVNTTGINTFGYVVKANHTDYLNYNSSEELSYLNRMVIHYNIDKDVLSDSQYDNFNVDESVSKLKSFLKPSVYSSTNDRSLLFEFKSGTICIMGWSNKTDNEYFYNLSPDGEQKVSKISSDENNENIIIKFEKSKELLYFFRYKDKEDGNNIYYDVTKNISFKNIPKRYRNKDIIAYFVENVNDKM